MHIDIALNQGSAPVSAYLLSNNISVYIFIPHVPAVSTKSIRARVRHALVDLLVPLLVENILLVLLTNRYIKVLGEKEAIL